MLNLLSRLGLGLLISLGLFSTIAAQSQSYIATDVEGIFLLGDNCNGDGEKLFASFDSYETGRVVAFSYVGENPYPDMHRLFISEVNDKPGDFFFIGCTIDENKTPRRYNALFVSEEQFRELYDHHFSLLSSKTSSELPPNVDRGRGLQMRNPDGSLSFMGANYDTPYKVGEELWNKYSFIQREKYPASNFQYWNNRREKQKRKTAIYWKNNAKCQNGVATNINQRSTRALAANEECERREEERIELEARMAEAASESSQLDTSQRDNRRAVFRVNCGCKRGASTTFYSEIEPLYPNRLIGKQVAISVAGCSWNVCNPAISFGTFEVRVEKVVTGINSAYNTEITGQIID